MLTKCFIHPCKLFIIFYDYTINLWNSSKPETMPCIYMRFLIKLCVYMYTNRKSLHLASKKSTIPSSSNASIRTFPLTFRATLSPQAPICVYLCLSLSVARVCVCMCVRHSSRVLTPFAVMSEVMNFNSFIYTGRNCRRVYKYIVAEWKWPTIFRQRQIADGFD